MGMGPGLDPAVRSVVFVSMIHIQLILINYVINDPFHLFPLYIPLYHHNIPMLSCFVGIDMEIPAFVDHEKREKTMRVRYLCPDYIPTIS